MFSNASLTPRATTHGTTLTDVLSLDRAVSLYGLRLLDVAPKGDLGLGLDPEGPVGFALIRGYRRSGEFVKLVSPLVISVFGEGRPAAADDADARTGEQVWAGTTVNRALRLELHQGSLAALLGI